MQQYQGTVNKVAIPAEPQLQTYTQQVMTDARVPQSLAAWGPTRLIVGALMAMSMVIGRTSGPLMQVSPPGGQTSL